MRKNMYRFCFSVIAASLVLAAPLCRAQVTVEKLGSVKCMLDLSGLKAGSGSSEAVFRQTLEDDLKRSGWFAIARDGKGSYAVHGTCREGGDGLSVRCQVDNLLGGTVLLSKQYSGSTARARRLAHNVADDIVWAIKKVKGIASTRIALVGKRAGKPNIYICDADGAGMMQITHVSAICRFPAWSPDTTKLLYMSYYGGYPDVYEINLESLQRRRISAFPGLNAGATYSPDGRSIALVLSKDGNPDLFVMSTYGGNLVKVVRTPFAAEASPSWSPDGNQIVFVSDKSGSPQLYVTGRGGGEARRITWKGSQNVAPDWGPGGQIAFTGRREGRYQICVIDPASGKEQQVTSEWFDYEDPSWAPDGRHIVCTKTMSYHSDLYILDTLGDPPLRLTTIQGEWYSPCWSTR
jgi:TolB protein